MNNIDINIIDKNVDRLFIKMSHPSTLVIMNSSIEPEGRIFAKDYGFLFMDLYIDYEFIYGFIIYGLWVFMLLV